MDQERYGVLHMALFDRRPLGDDGVSARVLDLVAATLRELQDARTELRTLLERREQTQAEFDRQLSGIDRAAGHIASRRDASIESRFGVAQPIWNRVRHAVATTEGPLPEVQLVATGGGAYDIPHHLGAQLEGACNTLSRHLTSISGLFSGGKKLAAEASLIEIECYLAAFRDLRMDIDRRRTDADRQAANGIDARVARARTKLESLTGELGSLLSQSAAPTMLPWTEWDRWVEWVPPTTSQPISLGTIRAAPDPTLGTYASVGCEYEVPFALDVRSLGGLHLRHQLAERDAAFGLARSVLARTLAAIPPGKARFTFFDPLGLGQSVSAFLELADYDAKLVDGKAWSSAEDLRTKLLEATGHVELVIQKYLRGKYETIDEFNLDAGEIAEPYRFLFIFDFPSQFNEETAHQLARVVENGPRCGLYTVLVSNSDAELPYGVNIEQVQSALPLIDVGSKAVIVDGTDRRGLLVDARLSPDPLQSLGSEHGQWLIDAIVADVGREGRGADEVTVTFDRSLDLFAGACAAGIRGDLPVLSVAPDPADPSTWWSLSSEMAIVAPIGQSGARDIAALRFDSESLSGGVLVGRPGSGKSTLLHTFIGGACLLYPPEELELYLIDFKEGVEFKSYATAGLPHARCVAVESEREFGLSVLESVVAEIERRGQMFRATGGERTSLPSYRAATGERLPRHLLVFDEFHVLFGEDDRLGSRAGELLETIIRQGRGFGVHVLLGSQSLAGLAALGRHVLQLLPIRLLLPSSEHDAATVLGDSADEGRFLTRRGEGVLNSAGGVPEANTRFQTAFLTEDERRDLLRGLRQLADDRGQTRRPVVFEGQAAAVLSDSNPREFAAARRADSGHLPLLVGAPMTLGGPVSVDLRRESAANVLIVSKSTVGSPLSVCITMAMSAALRGVTAIDFVDFTSIDEGVEDVLGPLVEGGHVHINRRRQFPSLLQAVQTDIASRIASDDHLAPTRLLMLYGLHRERDLDPESELFSEDGQSLPELLERVLRDGPDVGVHTVLWVDSVTNLHRRLSRSAVRDIAWRVAGPMSRDDSAAVLDSDTAAACKPYQVAFYDETNDRTMRCSVFAPPDADWLRQVFEFASEEDPR